jgi:hypothetical protein
MRRQLLTAWIAGLLLGVLAIVLAPAQAQNAVNGKSLYNANCMGCHGDLAAGQAYSNIKAGTDWTRIRAAINNNSGGMNRFSSLTDAQLQDMAAYIANPAAGNPAPAASLSTTSLAFGSVTVGSTSGAMTVTVTNSGTASLAVSGVAISGANAADFAQTNNCASVAAGGNCAVNVTFKPGATGARSATLAITHNATGSPSNVSLSGTGAAAPAPAVSLSGSTLAFGTVTLGTTSGAQSITLTNSGNAALTIKSITPGGSNPGDFTVGGSCAVGMVAAGANCTISAAFKPSSTGARSATVTVASDAANSPHTINLSGTGAAANAPAASITPAMLAFGNVAVGSSSAAQTVTVSNTGNADLVIGAVSLSGAQMADFSAAGCANSTVAAGKSCSISVAYKPAAAGGSSASLTIAHNAPGSPGTVSLSGTGVSNTPAPAVSVMPASLVFAAQKVNTTSAPQTIKLTNSGNAPLSIKGFAFSGGNAGDFAVASGSCTTATAPIAAGGSCTVDVSFTPGGSGARSSSLTVQTNAASNPAIAVSGTGTSDGNGLIELSQNGLVIDRIRVEDNGAETQIIIRNVGKAPIKVTGIVLKVGTNYQIQDQCTGRTLKPGGRCEIEIEYKGSSSGGTRGGDDKPGAGSDDALTITADDGSAVTMPVTLDKAAPAAAQPAVTVTAGATPSQSGGGCTIGGAEQFDLSHLLLLLAAVFALLYRMAHGSRRRD